MLIYTVTCELPSLAVQEAYLAWLRDDHLNDVVRAGAIDADATVLDADAHVVVSRYRFASREAFAAYEAGPAEALRREGRERFGETSGVRFTRSTGWATLTSA